MGTENTKESNIFRRGQIWYWQDPVFGKKQDQKFQIGEAGVRFSRYVLIAQNPEPRNNRRIIVIPISSWNNDLHDVPVYVNHIYHKGVSFAKVSSIMPVHPRLLVEYKCTIPDEVMKQIDAEVIKLLCPYITNVFSNADIKEWFDIDMDLTFGHENYEDDSSANYKDLIKQFMREQIIFTGSSNDVVVMNRLTSAFKLWCLNHAPDEEHDDFKFLDTVIRILYGRGLINLSSDQIWYEAVNITEFHGMKLRTERMKLIVNITTPLNENGPVIKAKNQSEEVKEEKVVVTDEPKNDWTKMENILAFIDKYEQDGIETCVLEYKLAERTVKSYYKKFKARMTDRLVEHQLYTEHICDSISRLSNYIDELLQSKTIHRMCKNIRMTDINFYKKIQSLVYFSFMELLNIKVVGSKTYLPPIDKDLKYENTWKFFDVIYNDPRLNDIKDLQELMNTGRRYYGNKFGITINWINWLGNKLSRFGLGDMHVNVITDNLIMLVAEEE